MDYRHGKPTNVYKVKPRYFFTRVRIKAQSPLLALVLALEFLEGLEVARTLCGVSKAWNRSVEQVRVWETFSYSVAPANVVNAQKKVWSSCFTDRKKIDEAEKMNQLQKFVYAYLVRMMCSNCWTDAKTIRICFVLQKPLCIDCQKLPKYEMVTVEQVGVDFRLSEEVLAESGIRFLTVPGKHTDGHELRMYYLSDIQRLKESRGEYGCARSRHFSGAMQARESELLRHFQRFGVTHRKFLKLCFETEGNPAFNFVRGRSQQGALKIAKRLANMYQPWLAKTQSFMDVEPEDK